MKLLRYDSPLIEKKVYKILFPNGKVELWMFIGKRVYNLRNSDENKERKIIRSFPVLEFCKVKEKYSFEDFEGWGEWLFKKYMYEEVES